MKHPHRKRRTTMAVVAIAVSWMLAVISGTWAASQRTAEFSLRLLGAEASQEDHEQRLRALEPSVTRIANDVAWIREQMEQSR